MSFKNGSLNPLNVRLIWWFFFHSNSVYWQMVMLTRPIKLAPYPTVALESMQ